MTVVAAIAIGGRVVMAADTASQYHGTLVQGARKIRRMRADNGLEMLLSGSGNGAIVQAIPRLWPEFIAPDPDVTDERHWDEWAESIASGFTDRLAGTTPPLTAAAADGETVQDGAFLFAAAGRLWYLFTHQALRVADGIAALGSGSDLALGVLAAAPSLREMAYPPEMVADLAVRIACRFDPHCQIKDIPQVETLG